jgi:hypothetical protein
LDVEAVSNNYQTVGKIEVSPLNHAKVSQTPGVGEFQSSQDFSHAITHLNSLKAEKIAAHDMKFKTNVDLKFESSVYTRNSLNAAIKGANYV